MVHFHRLWVCSVLALTPRELLLVLRSWGDLWDMWPSPGAVWARSGDGSWAAVGGSAPWPCAASRSHHRPPAPEEGQGSGPSSSA